MPDDFNVTMNMHYYLTRHPKHWTHHKAVVFRVGRKGHSKSHLILSFRDICQRYPSLREKKLTNVANVEAK